jgi:hypothetical protein
MSRPKKPGEPEIPKARHARVELSAVDYERMEVAAKANRLSVSAYMSRAVLQRIRSDEEIMDEMGRDADNHLEPFLDMTDEEIDDMILWLMLEQTAKKKLARYRVKYPRPQPVDGVEELGLGRHDVVLVGSAPSVGPQA